MNYYDYTNTNNARANFELFRRNSAVTHPAVAQNSETKNSGKSNKALPAVTAAIALASLGVAIYSVTRKPESIKRTEQMIKNTDKKVQDLTVGLAETKKSQNAANNEIDRVSGAVNTVREQSQRARKDLSEKIERVENEVGEVREQSNRAESNLNRRIGDVSGEVGGVKNEINGVKGELSGMRNDVSTMRNKNIDFDIRNVEVNGMHMDLASVMHGYGIHDAELTATLRSESAKRMLGAVKPVELPENAMIRIPTAEFQGFAKTGGLAVVPKELAANLGAVINDKQKAELIVDTPMYLGQAADETFFSIVKGENGKFDYISERYNVVNGKKIKVKSKMAELTKVDEMKVPIYTDKGKNIENVEVYISDEMYVPVSFEDTLSQFDEKTADLIKEKLNKGEDYNDAGSLVRFISGKSKGEAHKADVKYRTVFYKNDKFRMDGPILDRNSNKNIYNDKTTQAGETERFTYFCKYMYENLVNNHETADKKLKADWIIGNDWHTGPLSAMVRLLTPCRKAMGMEPEFADKLQNTPITTLMHNFKLRGSVWHSQPKLLNIMFGEHAAKVAENAHMPKGADFPCDLFNGLFSGTDINPQTMALSYSDDIVFVSKGNFKEMSEQPELGGINYTLAALRGRTGKYKDRETLKAIARKNGFDSVDISDVPTASGITNGCDRVNNLFTAKKVRQLEKDLGLSENSFVSVENIKGDYTPYDFHQHNKKVYLEKVKADLAIARDPELSGNPLKIWNPEQTNLSGVNENTAVFGMAGRIVDQKGIDIWSEGILKFYQKGNYDKANPPVFYLQGKGDLSYAEKFMEIKDKVRAIDPKASDRMVFANVFDEKGRYDGCKMMTDFICMPSWDEPCGLVHKEIGYSSGAISIVNEVGGLTDGLRSFGTGTEGANSIFVKFMSKDSHDYWQALNYNAENTANAFETALKWYGTPDKNKAFQNGIAATFNARYDWLRGSVQEYAEIGKRHGVLSENISSQKIAQAGKAS